VLTLKKLTDYVKIGYGTEKKNRAFSPMRRRPSTTKMTRPARAQSKKTENPEATHIFFTMQTFNIFVIYCTVCSTFSM
jgi:hypothetical protein